MRISEPTTTITNLLLGAFTLWMGASLALQAKDGAGLDAWLWSVGFVAASTAAFLGAASHGLVREVSGRTHDRLWLSTLLAIGVADIGLGGGGVLGLMHRGPALALLAVLVVKLIVYVAHVRREPTFRVAAYDYAATMGLLLVLAVLGILRGQPGAPQLTAGIVVGFVGVGIQRSGWSAFKHLNHNDLYHIVQIVAFWLVYRAAVLLVKA